MVGEGSLNMILSFVTWYTFYDSINSVCYYSVSYTVRLLWVTSIWYDYCGYNYVASLFLYILQHRPGVQAYWYSTSLEIVQAWG